VSLWKQREWFKQQNQLSIYGLNMVLMGEYTGKSSVVFLNGKNSWNSHVDQSMGLATLESNMAIVGDWLRRLLKAGDDLHDICSPLSLSLSLSHFDPFPKSAKT
jgi:hypothetical protein